MDGAGWQARECKARVGKKQRLAVTGGKKVQQIHTQQLAPVDGGWGRVAGKGRAEAEVGCD